MTRSISGNVHPEVRDKFFGGFVGRLVFLVVYREAGGCVVGMYAGHNEESVFLHMAGDDTEGEKDRHVIPFGQVREIEVF